jgi:hypothetical protein
VQLMPVDGKVQSPFQPVRPFASSIVTEKPLASIGKVPWGGVKSGHREHGTATAKVSELEAIAT